MADTNKPLLSPGCRGTDMGLKLTCLKGKRVALPSALKGGGGGGGGGRQEREQTLRPQCCVPETEGARPLKEHLCAVGAVRVR